MVEKLEDFVLCVAHIPQLKKVFLSCRNLEETYKKFKIMLNDTTLSEYKNFFGNILFQLEKIQEEDLGEVAGGVSLKSLTASLLGVASIFTTLPYFAKNLSLAEGTKEAEVSYSLEFLKKLPKEGDPEFEKCLLFENESGYEEIQKLVDDLKLKIEQPRNKKSGTKDKKMRLAKAIYRWVAKNIEYDLNTERTVEKQSALSVYKNRKGVCMGYANLLNLMMKMGGIPSVYLGSIPDSKGVSHAFNAIYIDEGKDERKGWIVLDSTWGSPSHEELKVNGELTPQQKVKLRKYFPAFYSNDSFAENNRWILSEIAHRIEGVKKGENYEYGFKVDGVNYELHGNEGNSKIIVSRGEHTGSIKIPKELENLAIPFEFRN